MEDWDLDGLFVALGQFFPLDLSAARTSTPGDRRPHRARPNASWSSRWSATRRAKQALGEELMGALERFLLLQIIDERWREHLFDMDYLREGIHLRGFAQIDPLVAYKNEAFTLFGDLMNSVWTRLRAHDLQRPGERRGRRTGSAPAPPSFAAAGSSTRAGRVSYSGGHSAAGAGALAAAAAAAGAGAAGVRRGRTGAEAVPAVEQRVLDDEQQLGRNDPCWCGSGKKFKKCHGA